MTETGRWVIKPPGAPTMVMYGKPVVCACDPTKFVKTNHIQQCKPGMIIFSINQVLWNLRDEFGCPEIQGYFLPAEKVPDVTLPRPLSKALAEILIAQGLPSATERDVTPLLTKKFVRDEETRFLNHRKEFTYNAIAQTAEVLVHCLS